MSAMDGWGWVMVWNEPGSYCDGWFDGPFRGLNQPTWVPELDRATVYKSKDIIDRYLKTVEVAHWWRRDGTCMATALRLLSPTAGWAASKGPRLKTIWEVSALERERADGAWRGYPSWQEVTQPKYMPRRLVKLEGIY
jgi:hypothetical protein